MRLVQLVDANDVKPDGTMDFTPPFDKPYDWVVSNRAGTFGDLLTPAGLHEVRGYADGIGPWKPYDPQRLQDGGQRRLRRRHRRRQGGRARPRAAAANKGDRRRAPARPAGASLHLPQRAAAPAGTTQGNPVNEYLAFYEVGVDGLFSDFADTAVAARAMFLLKNDPDYAACLVHDNGCTDRD